MIFAVVPPAVQELGNATGFDLQLVDTGGIGHDKLLAARNMLLGMASQDKRWRGVRPNALDDAPQLKIDVDQDKARALGLDLATVNSTIATAWGGAYVNDFIDRGRVKRVYIQADAPYRMAPEDIGDFYVRGASGHDGAVHRLLHADLGAGAGAADPLQRPARDGDPGHARRPASVVGRGDGGDGGDARQAAAGHRARMDRPVATRSGCRAGRRRRSTACRC